MKERVIENIYSTFLTVNKFLHKKNNASSFLKADMSSDCWRREGESQVSFKFAKNHKLLGREDTTWLEVSETFREQPICEVSTSSAMDNISISNINSKNRE